MYTYTISLADTLVVTCNQQLLDENTPYCSTYLSEVSGIAVDTLGKASEVVGTKALLPSKYVNTTIAAKVKYSLHVIAFLKDLMLSHKKINSSFTLTGPNAELLEESTLQRSELSYTIVPQEGDSHAYGVIKQIFSREIQAWCKKSKVDVSAKLSFDRSSTELDLTSLNLQSLPKCFMELSHLRTIFLDGNQLKMLPNMQSFRNLRAFSAQNNYLTFIPNWSSPQLEYLDLGCNDLLTLSTQSFASLKILRVSHNQLVTLPDNFDSLPLLEEFDASSNQLTTTPESLWRRTSLRKLNLSENALEALPNGPYVLPNLLALDVSSNLLRQFPEGIAEIRTLTHLNVSENELNVIPGSLAGCTELKQLNLDHNPLEYIPINVLLNPSIGEIILDRDILPPKYIKMLSALHEHIRILGALCPPIAVETEGTTNADLVFAIRTAAQLIQRVVEPIFSTLVPETPELARIRAKLIASKLIRRGFVESSSQQNLLPNALPAGFFSSLESIMLHIHESYFAIQARALTATPMFKLSKKLWPGDYSIYFWMLPYGYATIINLGKKCLVGKGGFKTWTKAISLTECTPLALGKTPYVRGFETYARNEVAISTTLPAHPTLARPLGAVETESKSTKVQKLLMNLYPCNLFKIASRLNYKQKLSIAQDILTSVEVLQMNNIAHLDLKEDNFLVWENDGKYHAVLTDFGLAAPTTVPQLPRGTHLYRSPFSLECTTRKEEMSPEALQTEDNWAAGLILYKMFISPNTHHALYELYEKQGPDQISAAYIVHWQQNLSRSSDPLHELIFALMHPDPTMRLNITEAIARLAIIVHQNHKRNLSAGDDHQHKRRVF